MVALFPLGQIVATPGALAALKRANQSPVAFLARHAGGDWAVLTRPISRRTSSAWLMGFAC